jgi:hypothetical protein
MNTPGPEIRKKIKSEYPGKWYKEKIMTTRNYIKLVHEREYVAEVDIELIETETSWSPYLSLDDAYKLDQVREALREGNIKAASRLARVFTLTPVAV